MHLRVTGSEISNFYIYFSIVYRSKGLQLVKTNLTPYRSQIESRLILILLVNLMAERTYSHCYSDF
jgi:hypothetical protein